MASDLSKKRRGPDRVGRTAGGEGMRAEDGQLVTGQRLHAAVVAHVQTVAAPRPEFDMEAIERCNLMMQLL